MKKPKQLNLFKADLRFFGGRLLHGKRRSLRPLSTKDPIHLIMRSSWATGVNSFLQPRNREEIERLIAIVAQKYFVRVYQSALVGSHLHLVLKIPHRRNYKAFVRVLSGRIASHMMRNQSFKIFKKFQAHQGRGDGHPASTELQGLEQKFWQFRPWSRVLHWGQDFKNCCAYVRQNTLEALGFVEYKVRKDRYSKWIKATAPLIKQESS